MSIGFGKIGGKLARSRTVSTKMAGGNNGSAPWTLGSGVIFGSGFGYLVGLAVYQSLANGNGKPLVRP